MRGPLTTGMPLKQRLERASGMKKAFLSGENHKIIAARYGVTHQSVQYILKKYFNLSGKHGGNHLRAVLRKNKESRESEKRCEDRWGHSKAFHRSLQKGIVQQEKEPIRAFVRQRQTAKQRGIGWNMSFSEWWGIWQESGKWEMRGRTNGYGLARVSFNDPFSADNSVIEICTETSRRSGRPKQEMKEDLDVRSGNCRHDRGSVLRRGMHAGAPESGASNGVP